MNMPYCQWWLYWWLLLLLWWWRCQKVDEYVCILPQCSEKVNRAWSVTALLVIHMMTYDHDDDDENDDIQAWWWCWWHMTLIMTMTFERHHNDEDYDQAYDSIWLRCFFFGSDYKWCPRWWILWSKDQIRRRFYQEGNKSFSEQSKGFQSFPCIRNIITVPIQFFEMGDHIHVMF